MTLVDQTTSTFQEKMLSISDTIDESLKQGTVDIILYKLNYKLFHILT